MIAEPLRVRAHAKINLDLRVGPRGDDGYHDLTTILQSVALHDSVTLRAVDGPCRVHCSTAGVPLDRDNLVWTAAASLWRAIGWRGEPRGAAVTITKRIPSQAGLGGGTSDAVAALGGLCRIWGVSPSLQCLCDVAAEVGADGPFFLIGGTALGVGRGDTVYPLAEVAPRWVLIVVPSRGVSTARAYGWIDRDRDGSALASAPARRVSPFAGPALDLSALTNDLERPVTRRRREVREATRALRGEGAVHAAMTGSGSAVFGLFSSRVRAASAARRIERPDWRVIVTRTLGRTVLAQRRRA
jgi:4-diphosphocytidyl-2-C-methyl-D-erythritol kinase